MSHEENLLTSREIVSEINGRICSLDESITAGYVNTRQLAKLHLRRLELRNLLSWIDGQNKLRHKDERINSLAEDILQGPGSMS